MILNSIVDKTGNTDLADLIYEKILTSTDDMNQGLVQLQFHSDVSQEEAEDDSGLASTIAIVEDDNVTRSMIEHAFDTINAQDILKILQNKQYFSPTIVYSSEKSREAVMQALSLGAKTYLVKPLKPEVLLQKSIEVLRSKDTM